MTAPLVIELSSQSVHIPKFQLEIPFVAPDAGLTKAALQTYGLLKASISLQASSTRDQRGEVMGLLQQFGKALYDAIFPPALQARLPKEGPVYIRTLDETSRALPLELLYDGSSFLSQTHGVVRLYRAKYIEPNHPVDLPKTQLQFTLSSHDSLNETLAQGCLAQVEEFSLINREGNQGFELNIDGDVNGTRLLKSLELGPDLFLFCGSGEGLRWELAGEPLEQWKEKLLKSMELGVRKGLRLMVLMTSDLVHEPADIEAFGATGLPLAISINGRIERKRLMEYFSALLPALSRGTGLLKAHRHAINQIQAALPLSWDWSWIRLHLAKEFLGHPSYDPLRPFVLIEPDESTEPVYDPNPSLLNRRCFTGNKGVLGQLIRAMLTSPEQGVIWLRSLHGGWQEEYSLEFFRRLAPRADFSLQVLYYFRWGYHQGQNRQLQDAELQEAFGFLWDEEKLADYFDDSLLTLRVGQDANQRYLLVYYPPDQVDPVFERWLLSKRDLGVRIILLSAQSFVSELSTQVINTDTLTERELELAFKAPLPEPWKEQLGSLHKTPGFKSRALLSLAMGSGDGELMELVAQDRPLSELWPEVFNHLVKPLTQTEKKLLCGLYLLKVKWPRESLAMLFGVESLDKPLDTLYRLGLVEKNLEGSLYWLAGQLFTPLRSYQLLSEPVLIKTAQELLQKLNGPFDHLKLDPVLAVSGVSYMISELAQLGAAETALQRGVQFAKRVAAHLSDRPHRLGQLLLGCVELASTSKQEDALEKVFVAMLEVLEHLNLQEQTIRLYEWFLSVQQERRNWSQVASLQTRLAGIYGGLGQTERARGHLVSATQLSLDLPDQAERFGLLIEIALALLELGDLVKLQSLLDNANFDPAFLNQQSMSRLWLIDGHLQFAAKSPERALVAFDQAAEYKHRYISDRLAAKTEWVLAKIYKDRTEEESALEHLDLSAQLFERVKDLEQAAVVQQERCDLYYQCDRPTEAIESLAWLYRYAQQTGKTVQARTLADELGGLYFRAGEQTKSTEFYKKAQELSSDNQPS